MPVSRPVPDSPSPSPWWAAAYGLALRVGVGEVDGLLPRPGRPDGRPLVDLRLLGGPVPEGDAQPVFRQRHPDGSTAFAFDREPGPDGAYLLRSRALGDYRLAPDGALVECGPRPAGTSQADWERMVLGHVVPLAAVLAGVELVHAAGVVLDSGSAIALTAPSTGGKTSVSMHVARAGAAYLTDDALALTPHGDGLLAHPGAAVANVRQAESDACAAAGIALPGTVLAEAHGTIRLLLDRAPGPAPLAALYVLERDESADGVAFVRERPDIRLLLASSFNHVIDAPGRLERQLDVAARLAARGTGSVVRVRVPRARATAADVAAAILGDAREQGL